MSLKTTRLQKTCANSRGLDAPGCVRLSCDQGSVWASDRGMREHTAVKERGDEPGDLRGVSGRREVAGVEQVQFRVGQIAEVRPGPVRGEESVVASLRQQRRRPLRAQVLLPLGV